MERGPQKIFTKFRFKI